MTPRLTRLRSSWLLPAVLSTTAGAVDVIGFLTLGGLFTAHITGNVVIVAAHYVTGGFSQIGPLLAVPVFMVVMGLVTLVQRDRKGRIATTAPIAVASNCASLWVLATRRLVWPLR